MSNLARRPRGAYIGGHTVITPGKPRPQPRERPDDRLVVGAPLKGEREADMARLERIKLPKQTEGKKRRLERRKADASGKSVAGEEKSNDGKYTADAS